MQTEIEKSVEEGNSLIADFMGKVTTDSTEWITSHKRLVLAYEYHSSWDCLMPVVEKIESFGYGFIIAEQYCNILDSKNNASVTGVMYAPTKKLVVFMACVKFIEIHIEQKRTLKTLKYGN